MSTAQLSGYLYQGNIYYQETTERIGAKPIYADSVIGKRMQERTLHFLFIAVMRELYPHIHVRIEHSFSHGVYVKLSPLEDVCVDSIIQKMQYYISQNQALPMSLSVDKDNIPALRLYQKVGFEIKDPVCEVDEDDEQYIMESNLLNIRETIRNISRQLG